MDHVHPSVVPLEPATDAEGSVTTRGYQQEMLEESKRNNIIIALDTGSGKTHIAVLRIKHEIEHEPHKVCTNDTTARPEC